MDVYRYIRLEIKDIDAFSSLDPYEKLRLLNLSNGFAVGVLKVSGEALYPAGLLCGLLLADTVSIEWVAVEKELRGNGIGEELILKAFSIAEAYNALYVTAIFPAEYEKEKSLAGAASFFGERLFVNKQKVCADIECSLTDVERSAWGKALLKKKDELKQVQKLSEFDTNDIFGALGRISNATYSTNLDLIRGQIDTDISFVYKPDKAVEGAFLVQRGSDTLFPVYLYSHSDEITEALICAAISETGKKYGRDQMIFITARQEETGELIRKAYGITFDAYLLTASVADYLKEIKGG